MNYYHVDFDELNHTVCKRLIKDDGLNDKNTIIQDKKNESTTNSNQTKEDMKSNHKEEYQNSIISKHQPSTKGTKV